METRICAADDCENAFEPKIPEQKFCSHRCNTRIRVRRYRARHSAKNGGGDGGGDGGGGGLHATLGGALEYRGDGSGGDLNRYSVKRNERKPAQPVPVSVTSRPEGLSAAA